MGAEAHPMKYLDSSFDEVCDRDPVADPKDLTAASWMDDDTAGDDDGVTAATGGDAEPDDDEDEETESEGEEEHKR